MGIKNGQAKLFALQGCKKQTILKKQDSALEDLRVTSEWRAHTADGPIPALGWLEAGLFSSG